MYRGENPTRWYDSPSGYTTRWRWTTRNQWQIGTQWDRGKSTAATGKLVKSWWLLQLTFLTLLVIQLKGKKTVIYWMRYKNHIFNSRDVAPLVVAYSKGFCLNTIYWDLQNVSNVLKIERPLFRAKILLDIKCLFIWIRDLWSCSWIKLKWTSCQL